MALDPQCRAFIDMIEASGGRPLHELTPEEARGMSLSDLGVPVEPVAKIEDRMIPGDAGSIPVRVYTPTLDQVLPALIHFRGGGWVLGSLDSPDRECRTIANQAGCVVITVGYRLSPEHKFPAAAED